MTHTYSTLQPETTVALRTNAVLFSQRKPPADSEIARFRLVALIRQRHGIRNDVRIRPHKEGLRKRLQKIESELYFLDKYLEGTEEVRLDDERISKEDPLPAEVSRMDMEIDGNEGRWESESNPLRRMALCLKLEFVTPQSLPYELNRRAAELACALASFNNPSTTKKELAGLIYKVERFFEEIGTMGYKPTEIEKDLLTACRQLAS